MKNIDLVFGYLLHSPNGVSSVVRLLLNNKRLFLEKGIVCNFHVRGIVDVKQVLQPGSRPKSVIIKENLKGAVKSILNTTTKLIPTMHEAYSIYNTLILPCKRIAKKYTASEDGDSKDPLFFHDIFSCYYYLKYTKSINRPIYLVLHNNGEVFKMLKASYPNIDGTWLMKKLEGIVNYTFPNVSDIGFVAKNAMDNFQKLYPELNHVNLHYVYNGLPDIEPAERIKIHSKAQNKGCLEICCVGSISYRKGQDIIIKTLAQLTRQERSRIHVTFVGDGATRKVLEEECERNKIFDSVTFVGNQTDVNRFLLNSDIFILTSRDEGLPMAILEAYRVGLPVISTKIAGIPEMINHEQTGLLINPDCEELLPIFKNIDKYDWVAMGERGRKLFEERFTIEKMIDGYANIFKSMK